MKVSRIYPYQKTPGELHHENLVNHAKKWSKRAGSKTNKTLEQYVVRTHKHAFGL
jgi:hypothetical protein